MRYLLVAKCIKCQAPISKNAGCRHMTCTRCKAEFCWICRKEYRGHRDIDFRDIRWTLGCDILIGDTAMSWLCIMSMHFFFLPFWVLYYSGLKTGLFLNWLCFGALFQDQQIYGNLSPKMFTAIVGLFVICIPIYLIVYTVIFISLFFTRLLQILKIFFGKIMGTCCMKCFSCCCY